jgi:hydrogenase maturation protease
VTGRTVVIGIGNPFRRDDGVGPEVVSLLHDRRIAAELVTCDGEASALIDRWTGAGLAVVVDAVRTGTGRAGRIHRFGDHQPAPARDGEPAGHAADLGDAVALARELGRMPRSLLCYAVEIDDAGFGLGLSPAVRAAARRLADEIARVCGAGPGTSGSAAPAGGHRSLEGRRR